jgi:pimeloyl-ACP methyl ester carboxylesterase
LGRGTAFAAILGAAGVDVPVQAAATKMSPVQVLSKQVAFIDTPNTYYEVLEPSGKSNKPPILLIHGGAHTGSCYLTTADGRPGWAYAFASKGYTVVVPDWPGTGRSGYVPHADLSGEMVVEGLGKVLTSLGEPAIVVTHSMSGPFGWKLLEQHGDRIAKLVAVAPGGPGNINAPTEFISETLDAVEVRLAPGAPVLKLSRKNPFVAEKGWASKKLVGTSTRFPREHLDGYLRTLTTIPPRLLLERVNFANSAPKVKDFAYYKNKPVALIVGTDDADHTVAIDKPIVEWLNQNGAKADFIPLGALGIRGNGHMMMMESNSDELAEGIVSWLERGQFSV